MSRTVPPTRYVHDEQRWPLVRVIVPREPPDPASLEDHLRYLDEVLARGRPFVLLIDTRGAAALDAPARDRIRQHRMSRFSLFERHQRGFAVVTDCALQRALMTAIVAVSPGPSPQRMFESLTEAEEWASQCMSGLVTDG